LELPTELLRRICSLLPCGPAIACLFVCRSLQRACDDWTVWRCVALQHARFPKSMASYCKGKPHAWKQYVIAGARASRGGELGLVTTNKIWMPQLSALFDFDLAESNLSTLCRLYDTASKTLPIRRDDNALLSNAWLHAQGAAFTLSMQYLSSDLDTLRRCNELLFSLRWPSIEVSTQESQAADAAQPNWVVAQHAIANRAVGFFYAKISLARRAAARQGIGYTDLFSEPPSATLIPFGDLMELPVPFSNYSLQDFSLCYLPVTTSPALFAHQEWTSYWSVKGEDFNSLTGVGGRHYDGHRDGPDSYHGPGVPPPPPGTFPYGRDFEGTIQFQVVSCSLSLLKLQSNNFYTAVMLHYILLSIYCKTRHVRIVH
jgi:hypothetical protein